MAKDPYRFFRIEAREILDAIAKIALDLERGGAEPGAVDKLLRLAHTLKGAARVVREPAMAEQAHAIEGLVTPLRDAGLTPGAAEAAGILRAVDLMSARLAQLAEPAVAVATPAPVRPGAAIEPAPAPPEEAVSWSAAGLDAIEADGLAAELALVAMQLSAMREHLDELGRATATSAVRTRAAVAARLEDAEARLREARRRADRLRLVGIASVFPVLERTARDAAQGRAVRFHSRGGDTRLDGQVLAALRGSLIHLVRNAVDHGIEPPDMRAAAGKPAAGRVEVRAERRGDRIVITCTDDGRGMDPVALRRVAVERGLIASEEAARLDDRAALRLALRSGLTTAANVTQVSGRGIGMDAAHDAVTRLKGRIDLASTPGRGTTVTLEVPVTLSSFVVLSARIDDTTVGFPLDGTLGTVSLGAGAVSRSAAGDSLEWQGARIRFTSLSAVLGAATSGRDASAAVIVGDREGPIAIGIDRIVGVEELVVRALPPCAGHASLVAGAALDQDGRPRLVLDPAAVAGAARGSRGRGDVPAAAPAMRRVLVIDDSLTTRMLEQSILESAGYDVTVASSAEEGLVRARGAAFDLFVVDVEMPGMDGFTFVATTRADAELRKTPAMLVTSLNEPEHRRRGQEAGARAYMVKSEFDQGRFLDSVRTLVEGR